MAVGIEGKIGIGPQTDWDNAVASVAFFNATEGLEEERGRLREEFQFGSRSKPGADAGRLRVTGGIEGIHVRPNYIGHMFRAGIGAPVTTGAGPYTHVFTPVPTKFNPIIALPPYTARIEKAGDVYVYDGGQMNSFTLEQANDDALMMNTDWIFRGVTNTGTPETLALEAGSRFLFDHLAITRNGVAFPYVEEFSLSVENNLETEETFNQSKVISAVDFGEQSNISVEMTLTFRDSQTYNDFRDNNALGWTFTWTRGANAILAIDIPQLNIESWSAPIDGPGRMTIAVTGVAEASIAAGYDCQISLTNDTATY